MVNYILRRLLLMVPTLVGMTLMLFVMARFAPGLTGGGSFGEGGARNAKEDRELFQKNLYRKLGMLDENDKMISMPRQYVNWLWSACHGEFGYSVKYNGEKVSSVIGQHLPVTLAMNVIETFIIYIIAIPGGMLAAVKRGKRFDMGWSVGTLALYSLPVIWMGGLSIALLANPQNLQIFPASGIHSIDTSKMNNWQYTMDYCWHLVLPVTVMCLGGFAYLSKQMRASVIDNLYMDYTRTARAKGVSGFRVLIRHVFRNSLLPLITIFATVIPGLLGGSVIIEHIFGIHGMGDLAITAVNSRDLPVLQGITFISSVLTLICLLLADICYAIADPRVSYE